MTDRAIAILAEALHRHPWLIIGLSLGLWALIIRGVVALFGG